MQMNTKTSPTSSKFLDNLQAETIKLGVDAHLNRYVVAVKVDCSAPMRPRRFTLEQFLAFVAVLKTKCRRLYCCYEAGPFGYGLHRQLEAMGVVNYVIRPINWDEHGKRVKTDKRDATAMVLALDGYRRGNRRSFSVVRVPTEAEERLRSVTRQRESLMKERKRLAAQGRSVVLYYGGGLKWGWWRPRAWKRLAGELEAFLLELLRPLQAVLTTVEAQLTEVETQLAKMAAVALPKGMGTVLFQQMEREVCDWNRFGNRNPPMSAASAMDFKVTPVRQPPDGRLADSHGGSEVRRRKHSLHGRSSE